MDLTKTFERQNLVEPDMNVNNTSATTQHLTAFTSINYGEKHTLSKDFTDVDFHPSFKLSTFLPVFNISLFLLRLPNI